MQRFPQIVNQLYKESKSLRFDIKLPITEKRDVIINNSLPMGPFVDSQEKYIPYSLIAKQLERNIDLKQENDDEISNNANMTMDDSIQVCNAIIDALNKIYNKYVDSNHALFMINISSLNRANWAKYFN